MSCFDKEPCPHEDLVPSCNLITHSQTHSLSASWEVGLRVLVQLSAAAATIRTHLASEQVVICPGCFRLDLPQGCNVSLGGEESTPAR